MAYFNNDFLKFFRELEKNNNREWFNKNKKRFTESVKEPFEKFIGDLIDAVHAVDTKVMITPKEAIFRIYRDTRFSKDKTPYKDHVSAVVSPGGRKDMVTPGLYIQMNHKETRVYGGLYGCDTKQLQSIRESIAADLSGFKRAINSKRFKDTYGEIQGEKNKRLPKEFVEAAEKQPLLFNKQFYYYTKLPAKTALSDDLVKQVMKCYRAGDTVRKFLTEAL